MLKKEHFEIEIAEIPQKYLFEEKKIPSGFAGFLIEDANGTKGFLNSHDFFALTDFIFRLKADNEKIIVIQDNLTAEEKSQLAPYLAKVETIETKKGFDIILDVNKSLLRELFCLEWRWEWNGELMWIVVGDDTSTQKLLSQKDKSFNLAHILEYFSIIVERQHDADSLILYSRSYKFIEIKNMLQSLFRDEKSQVIEKELEPGRFGKGWRDRGSSA
jgi:hypothetical protein